MSCGTSDLACVARNGAEWEPSQISCSQLVSGDNLDPTVTRKLAQQPGGKDVRKSMEQNQGVQTEKPRDIGLEFHVLVDI